MEGGGEAEYTLNVDEEKKNNVDFRNWKRLWSRGGPRGDRGSDLSLLGNGVCIIWKELPNNKKGIVVCLLFIIQAPVILNNASDEIFLPLGWPVPWGAVVWAWINSSLSFTDEGNEAPSVLLMALLLEHLVEPGSLCCPLEALWLHYAIRHRSQKTLGESQ